MATLVAYVFGNPTIHQREDVFTLIVVLSGPAGYTFFAGSIVGYFFGVLACSALAWYLFVRRTMGMAWSLVAFGIAWIVQGYAVLRILGG